MRFRTWLLGALGLVAPVAAQAPDGAGSPPPNILLVIGDDIGVDRVGVYGEHPSPGTTPVIDALAAEGILFRNAWIEPSCSPGRAALLTGRHSFRTGIGSAIGPLFTYSLKLEETSLAEQLAATHESHALGKWHLGLAVEPLLHPLQQGFASHLGTMANLPGGPFDSYLYFDFLKAVNGPLVPVTTYATTDTVNDTIDAIAGATGPWFVWLAFNAPHSPTHKPPEELHSFVLPPLVTDDVPLHTKAMTEAMDTELGRLFDAFDESVWDETLVVFIGDNGTTPQSTTPPFVPSHAKLTVYEGGLNVPLIIRGPGVASGAECAALVQATDLYATFAEVADVPLVDGDDSVSLVPYFSQPDLPSLRPCVYAEFFEPIGAGPYDRWDQATRNDRYKLIRFHDGGTVLPSHEELYDLLADPFELDDLLLGPLDAEATAALAELRASIKSLLGPWKTVGYELASPPIQVGALTTSGTATVTGGNGSLQVRTPHVIVPAEYQVFVPVLTGVGELLGGDTATLTVTGAPPQHDATLFFGMTLELSPYEGGVLVPSPDRIVTGLSSNAAGKLTWQTTWPIGLPSDTVVYHQVWFSDPVTGQVNSASNGLAAIAP